MIFRSVQLKMPADLALADMPAERVEATVAHEHVSPLFAPLFGCRTTEVQSTRPSARATLRAIAETSSVDAQTMPAVTARVRVLVVDDHAGVRRGLALSLGLVADVIVVGCAAGGEEAIAMTDELAPDVVVMDLAMPRVDGVTATRLVRQRAHGTAVVALSGSRELMREAVAAGVFATVLKDADPAELVAAIRRAAGRLPE